MKKYGSYLALLGTLIVIAVFIGGAFGTFCTVKEHNKDVEAIHKDIASQQKQIKLDSVQDRIYWLSQWIADTEKEYGENCARCTGRTKQDYKEYTEELKELKELVKKLKAQI